MLILSQNKKIVVSALAVFVVSFTFMMLFLDAGKDLNQTQADVLHVDSHEKKGTYDEYDDLDTPVFATNAEGEFKYLNEVFCNLIKIDCREASGHKIYDYVDEGGHAELAAIYAKLIQDGEKIDGMGPLVISSGEYDEKLILLTGSPILDDDKKVQSIIFGAKDLTEQLEALQ